MPKVLCLASVWVHLANFHLPYIRTMEAKGYEVHVVSRGIPDDSGLPHTLNLPFKKSIFAFSNLVVVFRLIRLIRKERYYLIYAHTTLAAFLCRLALLLSFAPRVRLIYVCHGYFFTTRKDGKVSFNLGSRFFLFCEKLVAHLTSVLVLMNEEDYASAKRYRLGKRIYLSHGMGFVPEKYQLPTAKKINRDKVIFVCVGELSLRKNQTQLLYAFKAVNNEFPKCELRFAGDGAKRGYYERLATKLGIKECVRFLGHVDDISRVYAETDILVSASRCEGLPLYLMEGLAFGLPIIVSDIKGHKDLIEHGVNGLLYDTEITLVNYMIKLASSSEMRSLLARQARLPEKYLFKTAMEEMLKIIDLPELFNESEVKISVIMGVYRPDRDKLKDAVASVLNQDVTRLGLIICDDGSNDGTYEFLKELADKEKCMKILHHESNRGLAAALNTCLEFAKGLYIARQDADDHSLPERFAIQSAFLDNNPDISFVGSAVRLFDGHNVWAVKNFPERPTKADFLFAMPFLHGSLMFRHELLMSNRYKEGVITRRAEDYELLMRIYADGFVGANLREPNYDYFDDGGKLNSMRYHHRILNVWIRMRGFWQLKLYPIAILYVFKPLVVGLIPIKILKGMKKRYYKL